LYSGCCPRAAKRPGCSSAAEQRDECATVHSITSSVVARSDGGTTMLSAFTFSARATLGGARPASLARKGRQYGSPVTVPALLSALAASRPGLPISMPWRQRRSICVRSAPLRQGRNSALERADCPICGTQPLHHHVQCEPEQRLAERWILQSNLAVGVQRKHIECTRGLGSDRGAAGPAGHQTHFSGRGMGAEAADAYLATILRADKYSNPSLGKRS